MTTTPMAPLVPSFVQNAWWTPSDPAAGTPVLDANTGEQLATVDSNGLDLAAMVDYARTVGQRELGKLTLHERALKLKELAQFLNGRREELYEMSFRTGATKIDSMVDIDGGIGVLFTFSSKGRRELPNSNVILDGPMEVLSRDGSFAGEHIYTRIPGVAAQINAFNFPVWGMLEKFAPGLHRRRADHRQAGHPHRVRRRGHGPPDGRIRHPARGFHPADFRFRTHPAGRARLPRHAFLHRFGVHRLLAEGPHRTSSTGECASPPKPTRSTPRSSAPTRSPAPPNSTPSSSPSSPR